MIVFEVIDKNGKVVHLSDERWSHIRKYHVDVESFEEISEILKNPDNVIADEREKVTIFYKFFKNRDQKSRFLRVVVKYLNGSGFAMSAYFVRKIR
ncbi:hypothetical protein COU57_02590 [Candidatus Pacearchaeota archaeon CG10_big_fil_rev_8_21_14_0_10_32_14]|nr:MAG: hypothetical protein COU57_02590 [Candidatus Pacearchaeota archaeon CG10_big_fil_rev_8_21_14_0_10_32_14]